LQISSKRAAGKRSAPCVSVSHRALCQVPPQVVDGTPTERDTHRHPQTPHWTPHWTTRTPWTPPDTIGHPGHSGHLQTGHPGHLGHRRTWVCPKPIRTLRTPNRTQPGQPGHHLRTPTGHSGHWDRTPSGHLPDTTGHPDTPDTQGSGAKHICVSATPVVEHFS
jgi:hypothetical protein